MDERNRQMSLGQAAHYIQEKYNKSVSRMTLWRWANRGRKRPYRVRLNAAKPHGFLKKVATTPRQIDEFMRLMNAENK